MAFRNAKSFAAARRASIRQMARQNMGSAIQSFAIRTGMAIAMSPFSPVAAASMGVFAASAAYNAVSAANRFTKSGASAAASMPGIARMNAARAVMGHSQVAMRQGQARVAAGRLTLARAAAVRAGIEMRTTSVMGMRARARSQKQGSDGMVDAYTRMQGGRVVRVQGYARP